MSLVTASNWSHLKTEGSASRWGYWTHPDKLLAEPGPVLSGVQTLNRRMKWLQGVVSHRCVVFHLENKHPLNLSLSTIHTAPASLSIGFLLSVSSDMSLSFLAPVAGLPIKRGSCEKHKIFKEVTSKRAPGGELDHVPFPSRWQDRCRGHHLPSRLENRLLSVTFRQNRFNFRIMEWDVLYFES